MSTITVKDGTTIFYKDWGSGPVVTFSHGWPLCSDAWDGQMLFLAQNGFRVVAHDRRGHGRSSQAWSGNDMNGYADDLAALIEALDLTDVTMVGHSTGGGEVARYIGRHGTKRVAAAVLIGAVPPVMVKSAANPDGVPIEVFDGLRSGVAKDRSQFWKTSPSCSTAPIGQARKSRRGCWISSGYGACRAVSRMFMTASRHFPRPTFMRISRKSTCQPWSCMVKTIKSSRLVFQEEDRPSSSRELKRFSIRTCRMASPPRVQIKSTSTCWNS